LSFLTDKRQIESYLLACKAWKLFVISPSEYLDLTYEKEVLSEVIYYDDFLEDVKDRLFSRLVSIRQLKLAITQFQLKEWEKGLEVLKISFL